MNHEPVDCVAHRNGPLGMFGSIDFTALKLDVCKGEKVTKVSRFDVRATNCEAGWKAADLLSKRHGSKPKWVVCE